jgi:hypothetical protein
MSVRVYGGWHHETYRRLRALQTWRHRIDKADTNSFLGESTWYLGQFAAGESNQVGNQSGGNKQGGCAREIQRQSNAQIDAPVTVI